MGNEQGRQSYRNTNRRRLLSNKSIQQEQSAKFNNNNTISQSIEVVSAADPRQYQSLDYTSVDDRSSIKSDLRRVKNQAERDQILKKLSSKNEELRKQLKEISDRLTEQIKRKKLVPKRKVVSEDAGDEQQKYLANAGIRRELQNGYRQVEMYKRTLQAMKGKNEQHESDVKVKRLENAISSVDSQIVHYTKKIDGFKKIKKVQDKFIEKDLNDDIIAAVSSLKKEAEDTKNTLKDYAKRDRQRDINYKKQQAYLFEVEKKYREMNGDYFPQLKKKVMSINQAASRVTKNEQEESSKLTPDQYFDVQQQLNRLKASHEQYHRKIDSKVQQKNKYLDEQSSIQQNIRYSDKVIQALKMKLSELKKLFRPTKKSLFGYDSYSGGELQSEYNGGVDQIQKQIEEQVNQDQFDIRHLIANIPKPSRPKFQVQFQDDPKLKKKQSLMSMSSDKGGMLISGQKSQPKKWGSSLTRTEQKGRSIKKQAVFDDIFTFGTDFKPLIVGINIWVNKNNVILGLQAIYLNGDEVRYGNKSALAVDGFLQRYDLQSPDYLKNITGSFSYDGYLQHLILYSKQGKVGTFGFKNQNQQIFTFGLASNQRPFRIFGSSFQYDKQPRINRLGIQICNQE